MWWIALYLPQWPLEALGPPAPDGVEEGGRLVCLGPAALQAGIQWGMSLPAAQARLPGIQIRPRQPHLEVQALRHLALSALRFSPQLCLKPDGLLIEVEGSLRLFGGPLNLWRQLNQAVNTFKVGAHFGAAPFPEAAWLLARVRGPMLAPQPLGVRQSRQPTAVRQVLDTLPIPGVLQAWQVGEAVDQLLRGLGVSTLGEWRRLPRAGVRRRLGVELLEHVDRAYGLVPDPRPFWAPPASFDERLDLPERTHDAALMSQALSHLLLGLEGWLATQGQLAQVLRLHVVHEARRHEALPDTVHTLRLAAPEHKAAALQRLWDERLQRHPLMAPVVAVRLVLQAAVTMQSQDVQSSLDMPPAALAPSEGVAKENPAEMRKALARLLDRLQSRLGSQAVQGLRCEDDHRPERASRLVDLGSDTTLVGPAQPVQSGQSGPRTAPDAHHPAPAASAPSITSASVSARALISPPTTWPQPLWLLPEPEPLAEHQGRPVHAGAPLLLRTRADRIEAGWFDGQPVCRDYHVAEGPDQRLRWVFRERRGPEQAWFLHGWFN